MHETGEESTEVISAFTSGRTTSSKEKYSWNLLLLLLLLLFVGWD
jgi:hypothetical protein